MASFVNYAAPIHDVRITQGDTFAQPIVIEDGDGEAIDLTGYSFSSQLRRTADGELVANFAISVDIPTSTVTRTLNPSVTKTLTGTYVHDFQWVSPLGEVKTLLSGDVDIEPEVTR